MLVKVFPGARERLLEIWDYTEEKWGEPQANRYLRGLIEAVEQIAGARHH